jgi:peptidoglycan/xylan/chitin deacetylase (PgdA/CDA1 family)
MVQTRLLKNRKGLFVTVVLLAAACALALTGCGGGSNAKEIDSQANLEKLLKKGLKPNEMGMVMVLEYHRVKETESNFQRSIDNFKKDLETLYQKGYRLVTFRDLMTGNIDVPAGTTPVVFTFDDSTLSQFNYLPQGSKTVIDPQCALGLMQEFYKKHNDFGYTALFNIMPEMFDQEKYKKEKLEYLRTHGFEMGNHTVSHPSLGKLSDDQVQAEIAGLQKDVKSVDPKVNLDILCLPYGSMPKNQAVMYKGSAGGVTYNNKWALLVGSNPFYPMYHYKNPGQLIPRIQVMDYEPRTGAGSDGSAYWLRYFDRHPEMLFISDGNPKTICAPAYMQSRLVPKNLPQGVQFLGY